ncbi:MAG: hypothetical protein M1835_001824 [Candelina submexicana]|nr:MAG: hypothetical protein M1835_001824 [Candelina submexicana]
MSDECNIQARKSTATTALGAAPSINWNSGSRAKIRTTLGGKKAHYSSTKTMPNGVSESPVHVLHRSKESSNGINLDDTEAFQKPTEENISESLPSLSPEINSTNTQAQSSRMITTNIPESLPYVASRTISRATQCQFPRPTTTALQAVPDSLTRRLVEEGTSIVVTEIVKKRIVRQRKPHIAQIKKSLEDLIRHKAGDGLLEIIINGASHIARYATTAQATKGMSSLKSNTCKVEGYSVVKIVRRFEEAFKLAGKFAKLMMYYSTTTFHKPDDGIYGSITSHLQRLPHKSMECDPKNLPELPKQRHEDQASMFADNADQRTPQYDAPWRADKVFLDQIEQQSSSDIQRRTAIHQTEVAYTDCCISDEVYDTLMLALLTYEECHEKHIGTGEHFKTPSRFRNWLEAFCLELLIAPDFGPDERFRRIAAEWGRAELSSSRREGSKDMGCSVTPDPSNDPNLSSAERALLDTAICERVAEDKLFTARVQPLVSTILFVRPLPFNEKQIEYAALFGEYQTKSIKRASNKRGDLHGFGIVDFATIAEAERAMTNLQGALVGNCKISLKPEGEYRKLPHMITVSGNAALTGVELQSQTANIQNSNDDRAKKDHIKSVVPPLSESDGYAPTTLVGGGSHPILDAGRIEESHGEHKNEANDDKASGLMMIDDIRSEPIAISKSKQDRVGSLSSERARDNPRKPNHGETDNMAEDAKVGGSNAMLDEYSQSGRAQMSQTSGADSQGIMSNGANAPTSSKELSSTDKMRSTILADLSDSDLDLQLRYEFAPNGKLSDVDPQQLVTCLICRGKGHMANGAGHLEAQCSKLWRTFDPDSRTKAKVKQLLLFCCECGKRGHYGGDCPKRPPGKSLTGGPDIWTLDYVRRCFDLSELNPYCLDPSVYSDGKIRGKIGMSVRGRANRDPIVPESESDNDGSNFYRPKVPAQGASRGQIRIATNSFVNNQGSSWTQINRSYDDRASQQSYRDRDQYYRPAGRPGDYNRRRSLSPKPAYPIRVNSNQYRPGPSGGDRWQPPLPREPVPTRGASRGRGRGRGALTSSTSRHGETYRPMPSAAKNARNEHLR